MGSDPFFRGLSLDEGLRAGRDNFLPLRHFAALMVIYGHSYHLSAWHPRRMDWIEALMPGFSAGSWAVYVFFAISGFLVTASLLRKPGVGRYLGHRVRRVYPAYLACVLLCVLALGPAFTTLPLRDYFAADSQTWQYLLGNLNPITLAWKLPGVFARNPVPDTINGSLWSLGLEVRWYAYLGVLALLGVVARRCLFSVVALAFLGFAAWEGLQGKPDPLGYRALSMVFMAGALAAQWREHVRVSHLGMAAFVLACVASVGTRAFFPLAVAATSYASYWVAYALPALPWPRRIDYSYGLFLYGFPVQQALLAGWPRLEPLSLFALAVPLALACAALSWHLLEEPLARLRLPGRAPAATGRQNPPEAAERQS
jgi:peptidoglycan/LPS O-acetylase OafA/YrhL